MDNFKRIFNNCENGYYGHGTNGDKNVIDSIFKYGLRNSHGSLYYTTISLGPGNQLDESVFDELNNWPHLGAKKIIIISLPLKYHIFDNVSIGTYLKSVEAFSYIPSDDVKNREPLLIDGSYTMPEFVKECYDAQTKEFIDNPKYYEHLSDEEQRKLFETVKYNYIKTLDESCGILEYKDIISHLPYYEFPITDDDINKYMSQQQENSDFHIWN